MRVVRVAVDAMGGDNAPKVAVRGAVLAVKKPKNGLEVVLVGRPDEIERELSALSYPAGKITVRQATQVAEMGSPPSQVVRRMPDASIRVCFDLHKSGEVDAVVSAGDTGATMACGMVVMGRLPRVIRPALASPMPGLNGPLVFTDVGANVDCSAEMLLQFGYMGAVYASRVLGVSEPKVGLLSIGEEGTKGNSVVRRAHGLLEASALNFVGNVEGRDLFKGDTTVVVCDGFVGNVALKLAEGVSQVVNLFFRRTIKASLSARIGALLLKRSLKSIDRRLDYATYGGAPLLGINGNAIICHGLSSARAIARAIRIAADAAAGNVTGHLSEGLEQYAGAFAPRPARGNGKSDAGQVSTA